MQAPFVNDELIEAELEVINQEFEGGVRKNFNSLLEVTDDDRISETASNV